MNNPPRLVIVGGPNGSGKSTFAQEYALSEGLSYLGADDLAAHLSPTNPLAMRVPAARAFTARLRDAIDQGESLVVEVTLAGLSLTRHLARASEADYDITLVMLFVDSAELCLHRIAGRVAQGGHDVPETDVRRRFSRSLHNFWRTYRHLARRWLLVYNGGEAFVLVAEATDLTPTIYDEDVWQRFLSSVDEG